MTCLWHDKFWIWQTFWRYDVFYTYWCHDKRFVVVSNCTTSWCVFTLCWHDAFVTPWPVFVVWTYFFSLFQEQNIMKTCFWYKISQIWHKVITNFWVSWYVFHVKMNFLMPWRVFVFMTNCLTLWRIFDFLTSWHIFYFMTNLWRHDKPLDVMVCFWCHDALCDVMTNLVTSWQTLWCHYGFFFILW